MKTVLWLVSAAVAWMVVSPAHASRWEYHANGSDGARNFYSPQSIVINGDMAKVWERTLGTREDMAKGIFEVRTLTEFDCARHAYRAVLTVTYPTDNSLAITISYHGSDWKNIQPASLPESLSRVVCGDLPQQSPPAPGPPVAQENRRVP
ncbi:surface-adhesin E family protein [Geobacter sp. SVR]|uniref:surface-adhesin E family protein n=1 Tax=Geobacter sp. SVR TaxID=2495594 RepID=UPI00143F03C9|nr:surface-adhesin E family protein [Geobacter sp. SVR]BCS54797.1 hypothetical protein GSVR_31050 [Geobacter sp. SVR]GCF86395.1 hypothetical protein GSbR_29950 [Geobacter sp. SVR]